MYIFHCVWTCSSLYLGSAWKKRDPRLALTGPVGPGSYFVEDYIKNTLFCFFLLFLPSLNVIVPSISMRGFFPHQRSFQVSTDKVPKQTICLHIFFFHYFTSTSSVSITVFDSIFYSLIAPALLYESERENLFRCL